jgi:hypothetical protein
MAVFDPASRYAKLPPYLVSDRTGRLVQVVPAAPALEQETLGVHLRKQGTRLDHLAWRYLGDATAWWRICELADVMHPDAVAQADEIAVPRKG